ncbi:MAG: hypothetical protein HY326_10250 [Chloroflexi bacterium]|nr:hypothetical protein [Chloroflexota bacterium]
MMKDRLFWTVDDYKRLIQDPDYFVREWAARRIDETYPNQVPDCFAGLLNDPAFAPRAAMAIMRSGDRRCESALLAALFGSAGLVRRWIFAALGHLRSERALPQLIAALDEASAAPAQKMDHPLWGAIDALGNYLDTEARVALWRFIDRHPLDDILADAAFGAILKFPVVDDIHRLVERYRQLVPSPSWGSAILAFAEAAGLRRLSEELVGTARSRPDRLLADMTDWLAYPVPISIEFDAAWSASRRKGYADLLPHIAAEIERRATARGNDLAAWMQDWTAGVIPSSYRWRMLYSYLLVSALAAQPPADKDRYPAELALCLALMGQVALDQNDEADLQVVDEGRQQAVLLSILGSPRQNVLPDVVERVGVLAAAAVPGLIEILEAEHFWAWPRALKALEVIARVQPGAAVAALPAILDRMSEDQSDYVMEPAGSALSAIGPAAVATIAERLGHGNDTYDIYAIGALCEIPTEASVDALLAYSEEHGADDYLLETLVQLGHPRVMPALRAAYRPGDGKIATFLYTVGRLNGLAGPEMDRWHAEALAEKERTDRFMASNTLLDSFLVGQPPQATSEDLLPESHTGQPPFRIVPPDRGKTQRGRKALSKKELKKRKAQSKGKRASKKKRR